MKAIKGNREYSITEASKAHYIKEGFDIYENGEKIASGAGKTVTQEEYDKLFNELMALKSKKSSKKETTGDGE